MIRPATWILSCCLFLLTPFTGKKEQLLRLSKKYFPENYIVLKEYDELSINGLARGNSVSDYISDVPTVVHEGYHSYTGRHSSYFDSSLVFRMNDTLSFTVKNIKTFPARRINNIVPDSIRKKIYRYTTYIDEKDDYLVTQQFGILGLLEEAAAYYQSFHTSIALFRYYADIDGWKDPRPWMDYLSHIASYRYAITEFELFISWYVQYARTSVPACYTDIMNNKGLQKMIRFLHDENVRLTRQYDNNRRLIIKNLEGQATIRDNFIYNRKGNFGKGLYDDEVREMNALLDKPEHDAYREFLH